MFLPHGNVFMIEIDNITTIMISEQISTNLLK